MWLLGGMHGCQGGMHGCRGHAWLQRGHLCLLGSVHGCLGEGHVWLLGGMHGCWMACIGHDEIQSISGWCPSYWNAFLLCKLLAEFITAMR